MKFLIPCLLVLPFVYGSSALAQEIPVNFTDQDVPTVTAPGSMSGNPTTGLTLTEEGSNGYNVAYQTLTGNGEIQAQVVSINNTSSTAEAGVFMTAQIGSTTADMARVRTTYGSGIYFSAVGEASGGNQQFSPPAPYFPYYVKVSRYGNTISGYASKDGINYVFIGSATYSSLPSTLYVGVRVCSGSNTAMASDVFDQIQIANGPIIPTVTDVVNGADTFVDSIGFNTHFGQSDNSQYKTNFTNVIADLKTLKVRYLRDGIQIATDPDFNDSQFNEINSVIAQIPTIKFDLIMSNNNWYSTHFPGWGQGALGNFSDACLTQTLDGNPLTGRTQTVPGIPVANIASFEGMNEMDNPATPASYAQNSNNNEQQLEDKELSITLWNQVTTNSQTENIPVVGPSLIEGAASANALNAAAPVGNLSPYMDFANMHPYPGGNPPGANVLPNEQQLAAANGSTPYYATETGYGTNPTPTSQSVSQLAQGKYENRLFLEYFRQGVVRTYQYQFMDDNGVDDGAGYYGIVNYDGSAKPAFTALLNLTSLLAEPGVTLAPSSVPIRIEGSRWDSDSIPTLHHQIFAKSDGRLYVALWQEVSSYNLTNHTDITVNPVNVNVIVGNNFSEANQYVPLNGANPTQEYYNNYSITNISVADHPVVLELNPASVIVDDAATTGVTITGSWSSSTSVPGYYGTDYLTDNDAHGGKSVCFTPNLLTAGQYQVYARWTASSNRATNVPISIVTATGTVPGMVNETQSGGQWVLLGTYPFNEGTGGSVTVSDTGANGYVIADAVQFVPAVPDAVILDNNSTSGLTVTGSWSTSTDVAGYYGSSYLTDNDSGGGKSVAFTPNIPAAGNYQVYAWWTASSNRATNVPVSIVTASGTVPMTIDETQNGGQWIYMGTYSFNAGTGGSFTISDTGANGTVIANAVEFLPQ